VASLITDQPLPSWPPWPASPPAGGAIRSTDGEVEVRRAAVTAVVVRTTTRLTAVSARKTEAVSAEEAVGEIGLGTEAKRGREVRQSALGWANSAKKEGGGRKQLKGGDSGIREIWQIYLKGELANI
jgi:hypothetical protein